MRTDIPLVHIGYSWIGPNGPLPNLSVPNIHQLAGASDHQRVTSHDRHAVRDVLGSHLIEGGRFTGANYMISPLSSIGANDYCVIPITLGHQCDFWHLFGETGIVERGAWTHWHLENIRQGRSWILIEHGFEAFVSFQHIDTMHEYFRRYAIPLNRVIYATGTANIHAIYQDYCDQKNPPERMHFVSYFPSTQNFAVPEFYRLCRDGEAFERPEYNETVIPTKRFLSFNMRPRLHRTMLLGMFHHHGLLPNSYFSYNDRSRPIHEHIDNAFASDLGLTIRDFQEIDAIKDTLKIDGEPWQVQQQGYIYDGNVDHLKEFYKDSLVSVCTETTFDTHIIALTEKCIKPIKYKHPFVLVGAPGIVSYMRQLGFKTFDQWWDESYDNEWHHPTRMKMITEVCKDIATWDDAKVLQFKKEVKETLDHNYELWLNNPYSPMYKEVYDLIVNNQGAQ